MLQIHDSDTLHFNPMEPAWFIDLRSILHELFCSFGNVYLM